MKKTVLLVAFLLVIQTFLASTALAADKTIPAADFTLPASSGNNIRLSEQVGEVVMINFWASWCAPCREEMPLLDNLYGKYRDLGFTILGINLDENRDDAAKVLEQIPVSFPVLFDPKSEISRLYDVRAMPTTILIDRDGNVRALHKGYMPGFVDQYENEVKTLIKE